MTDVLFVCTGNLCRSPSAELLLTQRVQRDGPHDVTVRSAGTMQTRGAPPDPLMAAGAEWGIDLHDHMPHHITKEDLATADLIVPMARQHLRELVVLDPGAFGRTFTLRELIRRAEDPGPRGSGQPLEEWLSLVRAGRRHLDVVGENSDDDITDPMGGPAAGYRTMLEEVARLTDALYALVWGAG